MTFEVPLRAVTVYQHMLQLAGRYSPTQVTTNDALELRLYRDDDSKNCRVVSGGVLSTYHVSVVGACS